MNWLLNLYPGDGAAMVAANMLLQVIAVGLLAWLGAKTIAKRNSALRYTLYMCALAVILVSPVTSTLAHHTGLSIITIDLPTDAAAASEESVPEPAPEPAPVIDDRPVLSDPAPADPVPADPTPLSSGSIKPQYPEAAEPPVPPMTAAEKIRASITAAIGLWFLGAVFFFLRIIHGWGTLRGLRRELKPFNNERRKNVLARVREALGVADLPAIMTSEIVGTPISVGILKPAVIVPFNLVHALSEGELADVLTHECAHIIHRDHIIGFLQRLAEMFYWPVPLIHMLNKRLAAAREEICDNYVLQHTKPSRYANSLVNLAEKTTIFQRMPATVGLIHPRWRMEDRIKGIMDKRRKLMTRINTWVLGIVAVVFLTAGVVVAGCSVGKTDGSVGHGFKETDRVVVVYAPKADFGAQGVRRVVVKDASVVKQWLTALSKVPLNPEKRALVKKAGDAPEYLVEFFNGGRSLGKLRIKGNALDIPGNEGWDFYPSGEDDNFVNLVNDTFKTGATNIPPVKAAETQAEALRLAREEDLPAIKKADKLVIKQPRGKKQVTLNAPAELKKIKQALVVEKRNPSAGMTKYSLSFYHGDTLIRAIWVYEYGEWGVSRPANPSWTLGYNSTLSALCHQYLQRATVSLYDCVGKRALPLTEAEKASLYSLLGGFTAVAVSTIDAKADKAIGTDFGNDSPKMRRLFRLTFGEKGDRKAFDLYEGFPRLVAWRVGPPPITTQMERAGALDGKKGFRQTAAVKAVYEKYNKPAGSATAKPIKIPASSAHLRAAFTEVLADMTVSIQRKTGAVPPDMLKPDFVVQAFEQMGKNFPGVFAVSAEEEARFKKGIFNDEGNLKQFKSKVGYLSNLRVQLPETSIYLVNKHKAEGLKGVELELAVRLLSAQVNVVKKKALENVGVEPGKTGGAKPAEQLKAGDRVVARGLFLDRKGYCLKVRKGYDLALTGNLPLKRGNEIPVEVTGVWIPPADKAVIDTMRKNAHFRSQGADIWFAASRKIKVEKFTVLGEKADKEFKGFIRKINEEISWGKAVKGLRVGLSTGEVKSDGTMVSLVVTLKNVGKKPVNLYNAKEMPSWKVVFSPVGGGPSCSAVFPHRHFINEADRAAACDIRNLCAGKTATVKLPAAYFFYEGETNNRNALPRGKYAVTVEYSNGTAGFWRGTLTTGAVEIEVKDMLEKR